MYSALASAMDIPLTSVQVKLAGDLDVRGLLGMGKEDGVPPGFTDIAYVTTIESPASTEELQALADTVERQCPVLDMLQRAMTPQGRIVINGADYVQQAA